MAEKKKKWWASAAITPGVDLQLLDQEEVGDCVVAALRESDPTAQSALRQLVMSHPEKIRGSANIFGLTSHAGACDDPNIRHFAQQQIRDILKARGASEPELVKFVMNGFRATSRNENPACSAESKAMIKEIESMLSGPRGTGAAPPTASQQAPGSFQLNRVSQQPFQSLSTPSSSPGTEQRPKRGYQPRL